MTRKHQNNAPFLWWGVGFTSALCLLFIITLWMAGTVYSELPQAAHLDASFKPVDVIVCLTGGKGRIRKALELYKEGFGKTLYISGTDRQVHIKEILKELKWVDSIDDSHIILENISTNTIENAKQVKQYLEQQGLKSVLLVTSSYHVRRAHYIFKKILPHDTRLESTWLEHNPFDETDWWKQWNGIWVTMSEFFKFFYAYVELAS